MGTPVFIAGPTASGKSAVALEVAQREKGEIISVDSMQVYRGLDLGTAKPTAKERALVPHHLIDILEPREEYNVAQYQKHFQIVSAEIRSRAKLSILCGGTGFYIKAVLMNFKLPTAEPDNKLRQELETWKLEKGCLGKRLSGEIDVWINGCLAKWLSGKFFVLSSLRNEKLFSTHTRDRTSIQSGRVFFCGINWFVIFEANLMP